MQSLAAVAYIRPGAHKPLFLGVYLCISAVKSGSLETKCQ